MSLSLELSPDGAPPPGLSTRLDGVPIADDDDFFVRAPPEIGEVVGAFTDLTRGARPSARWLRLVAPALGFAVPPSLVSNDPAEVLAFEAEHGPLIYKSASGVRSIVRELDAEARGRLDRLRHCPTLFQRRLRGSNVRVHVVGQEVYATEIDAEVVDYRYASRQGGHAELRPTTLEPRTRERCLRASQVLGLPFVGLDLMLEEDGQTYCFEANPSPGYSFFEDATGQDISGALARLLRGAEALH